MDSLATSIASLASQVTSQDSPSTRPDTPATSVGSSRKTSRAYRLATQVVTVENPDPQHQDQWGSSSVPIYQTATFKGMGGQYDYTRSGNPTRSFLEHHIAKISGSQHAFAVSSGMGALDVIFRLLKPGDHVIAGNDLYGGSNRLLAYLKEHNGIIVHHIDTTKSENLAPYLSKPESRVAMVLLESPTNPLLQIADLAAISDLVHQHVPEALVVVDNTMMSPYLQRPLEHGADLVYDSGTKYLSGHHDLMAGVVVCDREDVAKRIAFTINSIGNGLAPVDSFLLLRGIKTLALRLEQQQRSAIRVAEYLHALGFKVHFPGLASHPGKDIHDRLARGPGAVLSFVTDDKQLSERIVAAARLWGISVSFGCVNSLISMPCLMSHASIDPAVRAARGLQEDLIRLCVGIEDTDDLLDDLEAALLEAGAITLSEDGTPSRTGSEAQQLSSAFASTSVSPKSENLLVSAPGKVILFGEHAVVHGVTAIAGSVDLRCYCLTEARHDETLTLHLSDFELSHDWKLSDLPLDHEFTTPEHQPDEALLHRLAPFVNGLDPRAVHAVQAFLYLYIKIADHSRKLGQSFTIRTALPISAGLGSSAAYSVCVASSLLYTHQRIALPSKPISTDHAGRKALPFAQADAVNSWAFLAEKIIHGKPSGVDNSVASHGGALSFQRALTPGGNAKMEGLHGFKSLKFLLTDTKMPRNTKTLVAGVQKLKDEQPEMVQGVLDAIQTISDEAKRCLLDTDMPRQKQVATLEALIEENSAHLDTLQVSHPSLETIRVKTAAAPYNLKTKLTGAGGGGCAVTLIPDGFSSSKLADLKRELTFAGFTCYETLVGGSGFGVHLGAPASSQREAAEGGSEVQVVPDRMRFVHATGAELQGWAETQGDWLYV